MLAGLVALNQTVAAVLLQDSRGPLVLSGFVIRTGGALPSSGAAILLTGTNTDGDASIALEDGLIAFGDVGSDVDRAAAYNSTARWGGEGKGSGSVAIANDGGRDVSLRSVWIRSAVAITVGPALHPVFQVPSDAAGFRRIERWSYSGSGSIAWGGVSGNASVAAASTGIPNLRGLPGHPASTPPPDAVLGTMHSWSSADAGALAWTGVLLDAWRDCGATPDWVNATDDDGAALAKCFARSSGDQTVFLPRGVFHLVSPLVVPAGTKLVGAGKHCAVLAMVAGPAFAGEGAALLVVAGRDRPMVTSAPATATAAAATMPGTVVSDLVLVQSQRAVVVEVRGATLLRDVRTAPCSPTHSGSHPTCKQLQQQQHRLPGPAGSISAAAGPSGMVAGVLFTGDMASGRFYGLSLDHCAKFFNQTGDALLAVNASRGGDGGGGSGGGGGEIHLYQLSAEHLVADYQVQVWRSEHVHLHAFKFESAGFLAHPSWGPPGGGLLGCHGSRNVTVFGGSGNFGIMNASLARDIVSVWDCDAFRLDAMVRKPSPGETPPAGANWVRATSGYPNATATVISDGTPALLTFSTA